MITNDINIGVFEYGVKLVETNGDLTLYGERLIGALNGLYGFALDSIMTFLNGVLSVLITNGGSLVLIISLLAFTAFMIKIVFKS